MIDRSKLVAEAEAGRGMWIGLFPDGKPEIALGDLRNDDPHVTLAHLGRKHEPNKIDNALAALASVAKTIPIFASKVHAIARFRGNRDGDPVVFLLRSEEQGFRSVNVSIGAALRTRGIYADDRFDFLPHVTVARVPSASRVEVPSVLGFVYSFTFSTITLVCGDARAVLNLSPPTF